MAGIDVMLNRMEWQQAAFIILGSSVLAALFTQFFEGLRLARQFRHERRLRLDDTRRAAYLDYIMWFKNLTQETIDAVALHEAGNVAAIDEALRRVRDRASLSRTTLSLCASDDVNAVIDKKQQAALDGFGAGAVAAQGTIAEMTAAMNKAAAEHLEPYIRELLGVMKNELREKPKREWLRRN